MKRFIIILFLIPFFATAQRIVDLPSATSLSGTEVTAISQGGTTRKATINLIWTSIPSLSTSALLGTVAIANGGTGTTTPALVAGTNVSITGSWPNQTINSSAAGTNTQVQYNNAGAFGASPNFTFDGANINLLNASAGLFLGNYVTARLGIKLNVSSIQIGSIGGVGGGFGIDFIDNGSLKYAGFNAEGGVYGGSTITNSSVIFDLQSSTKAFKLPLATRANIVTPTNGMLTVDANNLYFHNGTSWGNISASLPFADNLTLFKNNADNTKLAKFDLSEITSGSTIEYQLPDIGGKLLIDGTNTINGLDFKGQYSDVNFGYSPGVNANKIRSFSVGATDNFYVSVDNLLAATNFSISNNSASLSANQTGFDMAGSAYSKIYSGSASITADINDGVKIDLLSNSNYDMYYRGNIGSLQRIPIGTNGNILKVVGGIPVWSASPLAIANGGTSVTSVTTTPTATSFAGWDANKNLIANNHIQGFTTTVTAGGTTALTAASTYLQFFTGTLAQTVTLPSNAVSSANGANQFYVRNNSTGLITVNASAGGLVRIIGPNTRAVFTCLTTNGTTAADWSSMYVGINISDGKVLSSTNSITLSGTDATTMTFPATSKTIAANDASNWNLTGDVTSSGTLATTVARINGVLLSGLATGILKNTTGTGVPSIAIANTDYQSPITLTTTGTSGAATLVSNTLNIPQYTGGGVSSGTAFQLGNGSGGFNASDLIQQAQGDLQMGAAALTTSAALRTLTTNGTQSGIYLALIPKGNAGVNIGSASNSYSTTILTSYGSINNIKFGTDNFAATSQFVKYRGTSLTIAPLVTGDVIGSISFSGSENTTGTSITGARIDGIVNGSVSVGNVPTDLLFLTGITGVSERLRINSVGAFGLSGTNYGTSGQILTSQGSSSAPIWATVSSGNVSNSGTPTAGQAAEWVTATTIQGVSVTGTGNYVKATSPTFVTPTLGAASATSLTLSSPLTVANGGTGTTTPALVAGTNVSITGSWPNQTINSTSLRTIVTTVVAGTDANITAAVATHYRLPAATLTANRTFTVTALNTAGDYIEINNEDLGFTWSFAGTTVYYADGITVATTIPTQWVTALRYDGSKIKIIQ